MVFAQRVVAARYAAVQCGAEARRRKLALHSHDQQVAQLHLVPWLIMSGGTKSSAYEEFGSRPSDMSSTSKVCVKETVSGNWSHIFWHVLNSADVF